MPEATVAATAAPRTPLLLVVDPQTVGSGGTVLVSVRAVEAATVSIMAEGASYSLIRDGELFWGVLGIALDAALGERRLTATARDSAGATLDAASVVYEIVAIDRPVDYLTLTEEQSSVLTAEAGAEELSLRALQFTQFDQAPHWMEPFLRPAGGTITTEFGSGRSYNGGPVGSFHTGTDFGGGLGVPVRAAAPGRVAWVGAMPIRGNSVILDHGAGVKSGYHHLDTIAVAVGDQVAASGTLGTMGATGLATGPHLHWEITVWGVNVDPLAWTQRAFRP